MSGITFRRMFVQKFHHEAQMDLKTKKYVHIGRGSTNEAILWCYFLWCCFSGKLQCIACTVSFLCSAAAELATSRLLDSASVAGGRRACLYSAHLVYMVTPYEMFRLFLPQFPMFSCFWWCIVKFVPGRCVAERKSLSDAC